MALFAGAGFTELQDTPVACARGVLQGSVHKFAFIVSHDVGERPPEPLAGLDIGKGVTASQILGEDLGAHLVQHTPHPPRLFGEFLQLGLEVWHHARFLFRGGVVFFITK